MQTNENLQRDTTMITWALMFFADAIKAYSRACEIENMHDWSGEDTYKRFKGQVEGAIVSAKTAIEMLRDESNDPCVDTSGLIDEAKQFLANIKRKWYWMGEVVDAD
jgi:hypothetical protein